jgi:HEAT repeat protein
VQALGRAHSESARLLVEQAISDPDAQVQARAIRSLGELGDKSTVATLARILHSSDDDFLKIACLTALGSINEPVSVSALQRFEQATNELLRLNAHAALARLTQKEKARK